MTEKESIQFGMIGAALAVLLGASFFVEEPSSYTRDRVLEVRVDTQAWMSATEPCWMKKGGVFRVTASKSKSFFGDYEYGVKGITETDTNDISRGAVCKTGRLIVDKTVYEQSQIVSEREVLFSENQK